MLFRSLWEFVGEANRFVDSERPWELAKSATSGDAIAATQLRDVLGDLLEACRLIALYAAPAMPASASRVWSLLGHDWPYDAKGHGGPLLSALGAWGALAPAGRIGEPTPLFPRLDVEEQVDGDAPAR